MTAMGRSDDPVFGGARGLTFVGRDHEMAVLLEALASRPAVVLVEGEAGVGKSRLVLEAGTRLGAGGVRVLVGHCHPLREPLAYGPVVDAMRAVGPWLPERAAIGASAGVLARLLPDLADRLPAPPAEDLQPGALRHRTAQGIRTLLDVIAPAVLVVEDMHWADEATRELLYLLARDLPQDTGLLLTYRREDLPEATPLLGAAYRRPPGTGGTELGLGALTEADLGRLARAVLGEDATAALTRTLYERSAGLPLIIEEDLLTLSRRDPRPQGGGRWDPGGTERRSAARRAGALTVPRSLREVMSERLDRLSPAAVSLANAAAVLAVPADEPLLTEAAGLERTDGRPALLEALAASVLRETGPGMYGFAHALACQAVHDSMPGPLRLQAHRRALAVMLEQDPQPLVQIAHHTRALGDTDAWLVRARAAADRATAVGDLGVAATLLGDILEQPGQPAEQLGDTALALSRITRQSMEHLGTAATLRRIMATPGLPVAVRGEIRLHLGTLLMNQAGSIGSWAEVEQAVLELQDDNPVLAARGMSMFTTDGTARVAAAEQRAWAERARALVADRADAGTRAIIEGNYISTLAAWADPEVPGLLAALPRDGRDPEVLRGTACTLNNAAESALCVGLDEQSAQLAEESLLLGEQVHLPSLAMYTTSYQLLLTWLAGRWEDWETELAAYRNRYPDSPLPDSGLLCTARGVTAAARGQAAHAAAHFERALAQGDLHILSLGAAAGAARLQLARGDADGARQALAAALDLTRIKNAWPYAWDVLPAAVEAAVLLGDHDGATELTEQHAAGIRDRDVPAAVAEQRLCRGLLLRESDPAGAHEEFERARTQWTGIGRPYPAALAAERAALALGDPAGTAGLLADTVAVFERLGATSDAARCRHHLRALGRDRPRARGRTGYGDALSPREQQVHDLLRHGATNNEIAAALFLSPRTAEHHVASVLRKQGTTREELARQPDAPL